MGEPWMMFTKDQGQELIGNTTSTWISINEVNGRKFTSKSDTFKYIFLPAGGGWNGTTPYGTTTHGYYWSSTYYDSSNARYIFFSSDNLYMNYFYRSRGFSIRPVRPWL